MLTKGKTRLQLEVVINKLDPNIDVLPCATLDDVIGLLRLLVAYNMMDLESTRRERDYFIGLLQNDE